MINELVVSDVTAGYGNKKVLDGINIEARKGEIVALIGHNGAGKSTLFKAIFGTLPIWSGGIFVNGERFENISPKKMLSAGICYLPQGNRVFADLSVRDNLDIALLSKSLDSTSRKKKLYEIIEIFPALGSKLTQKAGLLSGGERQMLSLANAFMFSPYLILLDEPSLGLSPKLISETFNRIKTISQRYETAFIVIEHKVKEILKITDRVYVLRNGKVSFSGRAESLLSAAILKSVYL